MVEHMTDEQIVKLPRGGHDYRKVYAAFDAATKHVGQPTVILAKTIKGWTIDALEGKNATHQMKKLTQDDLKKFRDRLYLPISDRDLERSYEETGARAVLPPRRGRPRDRVHDGAPQAARRLAAQAGGPRQARSSCPATTMYAELKQGSGKNSIATTMAVVRLLKDWMKDPEIGKRIVPIAPDEYRTFGMDAMFPSAKVYNPGGQQYESVDRKYVARPTRSRAQGQMLHEGISEAGAMASATAAGSAYSTHGEHMIPFYIFYSMFGFQRTGDSIWAMADQLARGFLIGATAGRTTLTGEGLQHADGHSPLLAATNPAVVHYDPAFAYEVSHIMQSGLERMYGADAEDVIFYITVYNEPVAQPAEPEDVDVEGILRGIHQVVDGRGRRPAGPAARLRRRLPVDQRGAAAAAPRTGASRPTPGRSPRGTSWPATRVAAEEWNLLHPGESPRTAYVADKLAGARRPGRRGVGLHARGAAADRPLGARRLPRARRRRVRLRRHPPGRPPVLPHRRRSRSSCRPCRRSPTPARSTRDEGRARRSRRTASTTRPPSPA